MLGMLQRLGSRWAAAVLARLLWIELPFLEEIPQSDFEIQHQQIYLVSLEYAPSAAWCYANTYMINKTIDGIQPVRSTATRVTFVGSKHNGHAIAFEQHGVYQPIHVSMYSRQGQHQLLHTVACSDAYFQKLCLRCRILHHSMALR